MHNQLIYEIIQGDSTFYNRVIRRDSDLENAKKYVDDLVETLKKQWDDGLGQSVVVESWPPEIPYQVIIKTMTAEAGWVMDYFSVKLTEQASTTHSDR